MRVSRGAVCPGSVSADKGQEAGNALGFGNKSEGLQLAGTPLCICLVFQRLGSAQTAAGGVGSSHVSCLSDTIWTETESSLTHVCNSVLLQHPENQRQENPPKPVGWLLCPIQQWTTRDPVSDWDCHLTSIYRSWHTHTLILEYSHTYHTHYTHAHIKCHLVFYAVNVNQGWRGDSADKGICLQRWLHEFSPWEPHGGRKEMTPENSPRICTHVPPNQQINT